MLAACASALPAATQPAWGSRLPALLDLQRQLCSRRVTPRGCRSSFVGSHRTCRSRHRQRPFFCQAVGPGEPGGNALQSSSSSSSSYSLPSNGSNGSPNGSSNGIASAGSSNSSPSSSLDLGPEAIQAAAAPVATMDAAAAVAAASTVTMVATAEASPAASLDMDTELSQDPTSSSTSSGPPTSESPDVLCQVDELDTPEALTDVQYSAPPSPGTRRYSSSYTPGTWQGEDEEEPSDPYMAWWKNRDDLVTLAYAVAMGGVVAASVFVFDVSIQYVHDLPDIFSQVG